MKRICLLVLTLLPKIGLGDGYVVEFPPPNGASVSLYQPACEPFIHSSATIHVVAPSHGFAIYDSAESQGKITIGDVVFPSVVVYNYYRDYQFPYGYRDSYKKVHNTADVPVGFANGNTPIAIVSSEGYVGCTGEAGAMTPPVGLPQITQKGNTNPYAGGPLTMHQRACYIASILSCYRYLYAATKSLEEFDAEMIQAGGYGGTNGRDVLLPVACRILGLVLVGSYQYNHQTIQKFKARNWGIPLKTLHWNASKTELLEHWIGMCPGVKLQNSAFFYPVMDPFLRANWLQGSIYKPVRICVLAPIGPRTVNGIRYETLTYGWWEDYRFVDPLPLGSIPEGEDESGEQDIPVGAEPGPMAQIWARTNKGVLIERMVGPDLNMGGFFEDDRATLIHDTELEVNPADCFEEPTDDIPNLPSDYSEACVNFPSDGDYTLTLSGEPGKDYLLTLFLGYSDETWDLQEITGEIGSDGKAIHIFSYDPITTVYQLGVLRRLRVGSRVILPRLQVSCDGDEEIFCQNPERICGIRVTKENDSLVFPNTGEQATIQGVIEQIDPEIVIKATNIVSTTQIDESIKPLGFSGGWPKMANCLFGRLAGKIEELREENVALLQVGNDLLEATDFPSGFSPGDWVVFNAILRPGSHLKVVGEVSRATD